MNNVISIVVQSVNATGKGEVIKTIEEALRAKYPELQIEVPTSFTDNAAVLLSNRVIITEGVSTPGMGLAIDAADSIPVTEGAKTAPSTLLLFKLKHAGRANTHVLWVEPRKHNPAFAIKLSFADGLYTVDMPNDTFVTNDEDMAAQIFMQYALEEHVAVKDWHWLKPLPQSGIYFSWSNNDVLPFSVQMHEQQGLLRLFINQGVDRLNTEFSTEFEVIQPEQAREFIEKASGPHLSR